MASGSVPEGAVARLREAVPGDATAPGSEDTLPSLQAVRSAMDAERALGGADPRQAEVILTGSQARLYPSGDDPCSGTEQLGLGRGEFAVGQHALLVQV